MLEAKRLAACGLRFYQIAMRNNDPQAAVIFVKASERQATLMGANAPATATVNNPRGQAEREQELDRKDPPRFG